MNWLDAIKTKEDHTVQRSESWQKWRKSKIGASEVSAVMGVSPFTTEHDLWLVKTGKKEAFKGNFATQRGTEAEPIIRELYEKKTGKKTTSPVLEWSEWNILSASLDGLTEDGIVVQFKYPSKEKHENAKSGFIPPEYECQLQAQLLVAGKEVAHYVSYDGSDIVIVEVHANPVFQNHIVEECKKFWNMVENNIEPEAPFITLESQYAEDKLNEYFAISDEIKALEEKQSAIKEELKSIAADRKVKISNFTMQTIERKGNVDYAKIPELKGVNLEPYRKAAIRYFDVKRSNGNKN